MAPGADAARPSAHARLAVIPPDGTSPRPRSRRAAARTAGTHVRRCAVPAPSVDTFSSLPERRFRLQTHSENYSGANETKQNKKPCHVSRPHIRLQAERGGGGQSPRLAGPHSKGEKAAEEARTPRRLDPTETAPHGDRVPRSKGKPQTGGHRADALGRLVTPRHARPGPRESRGAGAGRIRGALGGSAPCPHPRHSWNLSSGDRGAFWALRVTPVHLSWRWRCQFLLRWPHRRRGDQTPTGRVVGLPLWTKERPPSPSRSQDARPCLGAEGTAFPQARAGERSRRLLSSPGLSSRPASRMVT